MNICLNLHFLSEIRSGDLLTYLALILAYIAYAWSVNRDLEAWKSLFISLRDDLNSQKSWLQTEYFEDTYKDKNSFNPYKIIFPLSFESLPEIIRRGIAEFSWISNEFSNQLSLFNERVIAFNDLLDYIKKVTTNSVITERLKDKLNDLGLDKDSVEFDDLKNKIFEAKRTDTDFYLAEQIRRLNRIIHVNIIGNRNKKDKLHYLYFQINKELNKILKDFDKKKPFFIKYRGMIILLSTLLFMLIEVFLK
ncbi:MAG: hypothetical protein ACOX0H_00995 [Patescibacteria group bacterium]|jgi:hypothetical protein|nr:hypothetical protein [bacterium]HQC49564.1 hypothetical protein [bacterium]